MSEVISMNQETAKEYLKMMEELGLLDETVAELCMNIENNFNDYISYLKLGDILSKKGLLDEAILTYQKAIEISPRSPRAHRSLGNIFKKQGLLNEAISEFYTFVKLRPNELEPYEILGKALEEAELFEESADVYLNGIKANPKHTKLYLNLGQVLEQQNKLEDAINCYKKAGNTEAYLAGDSSRLLGKLLAKPGLGKNYELKWHSLNQPSMDRIETLDIHEKDEIDSVAAEEYFIQTSPYRVMSIDSLTKNDQEFLNINGFSLDQLNLIRQENLEYTETDGSKFINCIPDHNLLSVDFSWCSLAHQRSILETGYIYSPCPKKGGIIKSNQSFYIFYGLVKPVYCYRFVGDEVFYLIIGGTGGSKLFIYIPRLELIIRFREVNISPEVVINKLKTYCVTFFNQVSFYITDDSKKDIALIVGDLKNIGHHIWNELSAIQNMCDTGIINKISKVFIGVHEFLNIEDIFPELSGKVVRCSTEIEFFRLLIEKNYISVRVTGKLIQHKLADRIYKTSVQKCDNEFIELVKQVENQHFPLLWIQVRNFRVKWLSQVEGLASLIRQLSDDFPNLGVVFDGWSLPERQEHRGIVVSKIRKEKSCMENIINLLPEGIGIYSTIGDPIYKTIVWAYAVSLYVVPMGSGIALIRWIANKRGVVYGNKSYFNLFEVQMNSLNSHRENCAPLISVPLSYIREVKPGYPESDYDLDWKVLYEEVMNILTKQK